MRKILLSALLGISYCTTLAQSTQERLAASLDSFAMNRPQEKTYVQIDKSTYLPGETIWFKSYTTLGGKLTILSKVIYIDLVDAGGKVVEKQMLKQEDGTASGGMKIKKELPSGDYYVRGYTLWMLNFPSFITNKKISILNYADVNDHGPSPASNNISINFFPEGGSLINGLKSNVAFKAMGEYSRPMNLSGNIFNSKNEKVASFSPIHDGMGVFELTPVAGETYRAVVGIPGKQRTMPLPVAKDEGVTLSIDNTNANKTFIKVERSEKNKAAYNDLIVMAQYNYQVVYMNKLNIDEGQDAAAINKKNLPPGIMQITILTADGRPLAERIVFVSNHTINNDMLQPVIANSEKRKKNSLLLNVNDFSDLNAAISITNADAGPINNSPSILSGLLLSSDIKGYVNDPGYYFKDKEPKTLQHLDLVMLVNGWRRFNLSELMANKLPELNYSFETSMSISGKVLQSNGKTALKAGKINLIIKAEDSTNILSEAKVNEASVFVVDQLDYRKDATIYYQGANSKNEHAIVSVKFNDAYFDTLKRSGLSYIPPLDGQKPSLFIQEMIANQQKSDSSFGKILQTVTIKAKKISAKDSLNNLYASAFFYDSDQTLPVDDNANAFDMWQFLQRKIPGLMVNKTDTGTQVNFSRYDGLNFFSSDVINSSVQFFLNEVPVSVDVIDAVNPIDIGLVKIYKGATAIALGADRGAIALYTKKGISTKDWRDKGFDFIKRPGYTVEKEFYAMDYSKINSESVPVDIRPTLLWDPSIKIVDGKANIEFYNDDAAKKFNVIIEGIDANGKLLHVEKSIQQ